MHTTDTQFGDGQDVNVDALDALVLEYVKEEELIEVGVPASARHVSRTGRPRVRALWACLRMPHPPLAPVARSAQGSPTCSGSSNSAKQACDSVRMLIEGGHMGEAIHELRAACPAALQVRCALCPGRRLAQGSHAVRRRVRPLSHPLASHAM